VKSTRFTERLNFEKELKSTYLYLYLCHYQLIDHQIIQSLTAIAIVYLVFTNNTVVTLWHIILCDHATVNNVHYTLMWLNRRLSCNKILTNSCCILLGLMSSDSHSLSVSSNSLSLKEFLHKTSVEWYNDNLAHFSDSENLLISSLDSIEQNFIQVHFRNWYLKFSRRQQSPLHDSSSLCGLQKCCLTIFFRP